MEAREVESNSNFEIPDSSRNRFLQAIASLKGLPLVEKTISSRLDSQAPLLEEIPGYLFSLGGKKLRPVLCLLLAETLGMKEPSQELIEVSAGIELIHMATLLHDDIIDNSPLRRHSLSPYRKYGLANTLLAGDFLLVRAFALCAHLDDYIINATERACIDLTEGEILETPLYSDTHNIESSLEIARKKTASLFRLAADSAHHLTLPDKNPQPICDFAENLGIAFQILDDILDVVSDEKTLGKKPGLDIQERKPSLVNIIWLESGSRRAHCLKSTPLEPDSAEAEKERLLALEEIRGSAVIERCRELANQFIAKAERHLSTAIALSDCLNQERLLDLQALINFTRQRMS